MRPLPNHVEDQRRAAAAEMRERMNLAPGFRSGEITEPIRRLIRSIETAMPTRPLRGCSHLRGDAPQPVFLAAWDPTLIVCGRCIWRIPVPDGVEEHMCDVCRKHRPGQLVAGLFNGGGPMTVIIGTCESCRGEPASPKE